jgi:uncharacterized phage-associated protein
MASVHDVASYILKNRGPMPAMKLHKLAYYTQAWSLVWDDAPLFYERIEAWPNGPAIPALYEKHRGQFEVRSWPHGSSATLAAVQAATIDVILDTYGKKSSQWLANLSHAEDPWRNARKRLAAGQSGHEEITTAAMANYYSSLSEENSVAVG